MPFSELPCLTLIEYDVGTHIRCIRVNNSLSQSSMKVGGFELRKELNFEGRRIVKVVFSRFRREKKVGGVEFTCDDGTKFLL